MYEYLDRIAARLNAIERRLGIQEATEYAAGTAGGGGSVDQFTELTDTPSSYSGAANHFVKVNATPDGLAFVSVGLGDLSGDLDDIAAGTTNKHFTATDENKLDGIENNAEVNNISDANATDLTDGGDSTLHYHATDRARANHTGTQAMSTISDAGALATLNTVGTAQIDDGAITEPKLDAIDTPSNGEVLSYNSGSAAFEWINPAAATDHGALTGLTDDDHTQYARLGGRSGGQTLYGGPDAGENLYIYSTPNITKGTIFIGNGGTVRIGYANATPGRTRMPGGASIYQVWADTAEGLTLADDAGNAGIYIEDGGAVHIGGTTSPASELEVSGTITVDGRVSIAPASGDAVVELFPSSGDDVNLFSSATDDRYGFFNYTTSATDLAIKHSDGYVGIGQTNPEDRLVVELDQANPTRVSIDNNNASGFQVLQFREGAGTFPGWLLHDNATGDVVLRGNDTGVVEISAGNGQDLILNLFADRGDDNNDRWRIKVTQGGGGLQIQSFSTGSWVTKASYTA